MPAVSSLPKTGTIGQIVTYNGYNYQWTGVGWKNLGVATISVGNTNISSNGVSTGNTSITGNSISTGNTSVTSNGISTGNTTVSSNGVSTGNTSITGNSITTGNTSITTDGISTGNTSVTANGISAGNTTVTANGISAGNTTVTANGVSTGNTSITGNSITTGNTSITSNGISTGNTSVTANGVSVGNVSVSNTGVNVGNVSVSNTGVNVGNVTLSNTGVNVGNVTLSNTGVNVGNVSVSNTGVNVGNVTLSNTGVNVGNVSLSNTGVNVGNVTLSNTGVNVGNVSVSNAGVNVGNVSLSNTGVNVGTVSLSNTGLTTGNTSVTGNSITTANLIVTTITGTGNIDIGNNHYFGNGRFLTGVAADTVIGSIPNLTATGNINFTGAANITLGNVSNINLGGGNAGDYLKTNGNGIISFAPIQARLVSNITSIVAGSALDISIDYSNVSYPAGVFTINQLGPISLNTTTAWATGGSSKNAYANFIATTVNTQNVSITLSLANANFTVQSGDTITIGGSTVTGANLTGLGITSTGGTYTIPSTFLTPIVQTQSTDSVSVSLTTNRGVQTSNGTTLTNNQPIPFNVTAISGTFGSSTVPYWSLDQTFNWNATTTSGASGITGNVSYANSAASISGSLTTTGTTSGTSASVDSTNTYTLTSSDYNGTGGFGAGQRTIPSTVTGTVNPATKYYPLFWKTTANSTIPAFTTSDSRNSNNFAVGQSANTTATPSNYLWMATPNNTSRTFKHIFLGSDIVDTPDVTSTTTISGHTYKIWGFTNFSAITAIITTS
jgi:hypothetical protein